ncbi:angiopoietin-related protein 7-like [Pecten maximus]|uniref:angiopoietin-related protein 7-like n=1 Tax=Pecten maximus TaxID=6579 RepID=UPI001459187F|nr:angiopoietin-related protein 7-like [Pecten maximus]
METEECLSFSYTVDEQKCETYSQYIKEQLDADISTATMYFSKVVVSSCRDMPHMYPSGIYPITTPEKNSLFLYCDMNTAGGPWTVIHRRTKGDVDFYSEWADYKRGFGTLHGDFWIGNDNLHLLTNTPRKLRVELQAWDGTWGYAEYTNFRVADETENYKLLVNGFSGNVSYNPMDISNGSPFSTKDKDNDESSLHCAVSLKSGWWHKGCTDVNLNGLYLNPTDVDDGGMSVMRWNYFPYPDTKYNSLKQAMMMIRPSFDRWKASPKSLNRELNLIS